MSSSEQIFARFLLFDLDGTLVDSAESIGIAWDRFAGRYNVAQPDLERALGGTTIDTLRELLPASEVCAANAYHTQLSLDTAVTVRAFPGAAELLTELPDKRWGIVTSSTRAVAIRKLDAAGLPHPAHIVTADDYADGKPSSEPYTTALGLVGVSAGDSVAFEDSLPGIESATRAGLRVVGVATYEPPSKLGTRWTISTWSQVRARQHQHGLTLALSGP